MSRIEIIKAKSTPYPKPISGMSPVTFKLAHEAVISLKKAVEKGDETSSHLILKKHPELCRDIMTGVGHHGMWFCNKPQICPPLTNGKKGKIPDLLLAGKGSGGMAWFVVELKAPQDSLFNNRGHFSSRANQGLSQLAGYLNYAIEKQGTLRDGLEIKEFKTPKGILVIGREKETLEDEIKGELKTFWNNQLQNIEIISFDRIISTAEARL